MAAVPANNAFGAHAPSWNLSFPDGRLTAAEILCYIPHSLKSVDVIDRFITNGAKSYIIAAIINEFRDRESSQPWAPNSAQVMMSYSMRRAGFKDWKVGTHNKFPRHRDLSENDLNVKDFRPPRLTHPKDVGTINPELVAHNREPGPISFRDLALHVKRHPTGHDALDLTRCVLYALDHKDKDWMYPTDFSQLLSHLGGPERVTHAHLDRQVFRRHTKSPRASANITPRKLLRTLTARPLKKIAAAASIGLVPRSQSLLPRKRALEHSTSETMVAKRRSGRLVGKVINMREESDPELDEADVQDSGLVTPSKKRKTSHIPPAPPSPIGDSDFVQHESDADDEVLEDEDATDDEDFAAPKRTPGRAAARKARQNIQATIAANAPSFPSRLLSQPFSLTPNFQPPPRYLTARIDPLLMHAARDFGKSKPAKLAAPFLYPDRLKVDAQSLYLYAAEGCTTVEEMWVSALSYDRFRGPRRSAPFRELYRLTDPRPLDSSDWAENIRWAKQQFNLYGSITWTEYDYHLTQITEHRRMTMWVSEEAVQAGI